MNRLHKGNITYFFRSIGPLLFCLLTFSTNAQTYKVEEVTYNFEIFDLKGINSRYADFCPVLLGDKIIFTSGRESNLVLLGENNWKATGFLNVFTTDLKGEFSDSVSCKSVELFSESLANNNHTGPVAFTATGDTIFYTQTTTRIKNKKEVRHPQLFMAIKKDGKWESSTKLPFCLEDYSFGHPSWDAASQTLYFSSDMPDGKGGKDIYSCQLVSGQWKSPVNLAFINTASDEMFPGIIGQDLFFASNREGGKGGLDLYWKILNYDKDIENLAQLNSPGDELGLFVTADKTKGMYSSTGLIGENDDIKYLNVERVVTVSNELAGKFRYRKLNLDANDLKVELYRDGELVIDQKTDDKGSFIFKRLPYENYTVKVKSEEDLELIIFDREGNPVTELLRDTEGAFQYKKIGSEQAGTLSLMTDEMKDFEMRRGWVSGQFVYEKLPGEYADCLRVMLTNEEGEIIFTQYTDERGNFDFKNISLDTNYVLTVDGGDEQLILLMFDQDGNVIAQLKQNEKGEFLYKKIKPEFQNNLNLLTQDEDVFELKTMTVTGNFNYRKLDGEFGEGLKVYIYSDDGILIDSTYTDARGQFRFTLLDPEKSYLYKIDESDPKFELDEFNLLVEDRYGNVLASLFRGQDGYFVYRNLEVVADNNLDTIKETETTFNLVTPVSSDATIFFDLNSSYPAKDDYKQLADVITNLKSDKSSSVKIYAYADARSTDAYNVWLSEKRGNRIRDYLVRHGISSDRIEVTAFGESKLFNSCSDENSCSEEDHATNRRVVVSIMK